MTMIQSAIAALVEGKHLSQQQAYDAMNEIMSGAATESQISAFLVALRMNGETAEEIAGCARVMREKAVQIRTTRTNVIDTCGTGGDGSGTFNISTTAAIVACAAGANVAKHGNRSVSSKCGSADVLRALGVNIDLPPDGASKILDEIGITFLFAPLMHQAMKYAMNVRKDLALRTVFNILGPLTNPAGAKRQVLGVFAPQMTETMATVLQSLGSEHALVVHGAGGLDELSTLGSTRISELKNGKVSTFVLEKQETGFPMTAIELLRGADATTNAEIAMAVLSGKRGPQRDIVLLNAGAAVYVSGMASSVQEGIKVAQDAIDADAANRKLREWQESTMSYRA